MATPRNPRPARKLSQPALGILTRGKKPGKRIGQESVRVYEYLRDQIVTGKLVQGSHLAQSFLAKSLGTSNGPVITALRKLANEGLVYHARGQGCTVTEWSDSQLEDQLIVRRALETEAARLASRRIGNEDLENLHRLVDGMAALVKEGKKEEARLLDVEFHTAIAVLTRSPGLQEALGKCHLLEVVRRRLLGNMGNEDFTHLAENHRLLVKAIASGDPEEAAKAMHYHLRSKSPSAMRS